MIKVLFAAPCLLVSGLLAGSAVASPDCDQVADRLVAGDGIWRAVNDDQYERTFRFAKAGGILKVEALRPSLRFSSIKDVQPEIGDGKLYIRFKDERGEHVQQYRCTTDAKLRGYADGPTDMGSYSHAAVLFKLDGYAPPRPPQASPAPAVPDDNTW